jgi:hypothetical protein
MTGEFVSFRETHSTIGWAALPVFSGERDRHNQVNPVSPKPVGAARQQGRPRRLRSQFQLKLFPAKAS